MHIADPATGNLGANAIVGGSAGIATGAALSALMRGSGQVAACFFGEGALGQGLLYEVMNIAALWTLPVIYVCENNLYCEYTPFRESTAGEIAARPAAFGIESLEVDGQDVRAVHAAAATLVARARAGDGPGFLVANTYRYLGHHVGDVDRAYYRAREEEERWRDERDPIALLGAWLREQGVAQGRLDETEARARGVVERGVEWALAEPLPDAAGAAEHVYA
jgi:pyruvate dehydrogenase E1 component alpha subunit